MNKEFYDEQGSTSIEAAITVPTIVFFITLLYLYLLSIRVDLIYQEAAYSAVNELSLITTLISDDEFLINNDYFNVKDSVATLIKKHISSTWINSRHNHWIEKNLDEKWIDFYIKGRNGELYNDGNTLIYEYSYSGPQIFGMQKNIERLIVPYWGGLGLEVLNSEDGADSEVSDEIWSESSFARGRYFRDYAGANLAFNFPVIARFENGNAYSIKSIDLTAPSYSNLDYLGFHIDNLADQLSQFYGVENWGKDNINIHRTDIRNKILYVIVPENSSQAHLNVLNKKKREWQAQNIEITIEKTGRSKKYEE